MQPPTSKKSKNHYGIDLERYSLKRLQRSLKNREMIPSRLILKEDTAERFDILSSFGINNLKQLADELKTKDKIIAFSKKSNLTIEYLTILNREVKSYIPKAIMLKKLPLVNAKAITSLERIGIVNTKQLFNMAMTEGGKQQILKSTGIAVNDLNELVSLSDIGRLYGVGPIFARILYQAGIRSVKAFAECDAEEFVRIYERDTKKKADFSASEIEFTIELAKSLASDSDN